MSRTEKYTKMVLLVMKGYTLASVGELFGVTGTWVRFVVSRESMKMLDIPIDKGRCEIHLRGDDKPVRIKWIKRKYKHRLIAICRNILEDTGNREPTSEIEASADIEPSSAKV